MTTIKTISSSGVSKYLGTLRNREYELAKTQGRAHELIGSEIPYTVRKDEHNDDVLVLVSKARGFNTPVTDEQAAARVAELVETLRDGGYVCKPEPWRVRLTARAAAVDAAPEQPVAGLWASDMADHALRERFPQEWREEYDKALKTYEAQ